MSFFSRPQIEVEPSPVESLEISRLRELNALIPALDSELANAESEIRRFFGGSVDPRQTSLRSEGALVQISDYPRLRMLEIRRDEVIGQRNRALAERAGLLP